MENTVQLISSIQSILDNRSNHLTQEDKEALQEVIQIISDHPPNKSSKERIGRALLRIVGTEAVQELLKTLFG